MGPVLALVSIVKNEASCIARTIASVRGVVDHITIADTGSTDGTREEVSRIGQEIWPGTQHVWDETFIDYAQARNLARDIEATRRTEPATYALSLSADETLHGGEHLRAFLEGYNGDETAFLVEVRTPSGVFDYPRVLSVRGPWRYEDATHEQPIHQAERDRRPSVKIPDCWIEYAPTDPERLGRRLRDLDVPILTRLIAEAKDPAAKARAVSLLAQTREQIAATIKDDVFSASQEMFSALGCHAFLSMSADAPTEAQRHASWRYLNVAEMLGVYFPHEMALRLQPIVRDDPKNPAAAYMLARHTAAIDEHGVVRGDAKAGLHAAYKAAQAARDAVADPNKPHDPHGLLWRSHYLAAMCAASLGHRPAAKKSAEAGIKGGGPREIFEPFLK